MFKNKNAVAKISNFFLIFMIVCCFLPIISLAFGDISELKEVGYSQNDITYSIISTSLCLILSLIGLFITNKKKIYNDEYPITRCVFNFFVVVSIISLILSFILNILNLYFYKSFSWVVFFTLIFGDSIGYYLAIRFVDKDNLFKKSNEIKVNIANLVIVILLINYYVEAISIIFSIIFGTEKILTLLISLITSLVWIVVIVISYKLINKKELKFKKIIKHN